MPMLKLKFYFNIEIECQLQHLHILVSKPSSSYISRYVDIQGCPCGTRLGLVGQIRPWGQEWVRTPLRAPHLPGVVTYNSGLLSYLNATIPVSIDALYGMLSKFACLLLSAGVFALGTIPPNSHFTHICNHITHT